MDFFPTVITGDVVQIPLRIFLFFFCFALTIPRFFILSEHQLVFGSLGFRFPTKIRLIFLQDNLYRCDSLLVF